MDVLVSRRRGQAPPPKFIYQALTQSLNEPSMRWLKLQDGEIRPRLLRCVEPCLVEWSSIWTTHPEALIRFEIEPDGGGTMLRWLVLGELEHEPEVLRHMRSRMNRLINADLRHSFGQGG